MDPERTVDLNPKPKAETKPAAAKAEKPAEKSAPKGEAPKIEPTLGPRSKAETQGFKPETAADAWLGLMAARGIEYLFANGGTDFAPVVEAYAKGQKLGWRLPKISTSRSAQFIRVKSRVSNWI